VPAPTPAALDRNSDAVGRRHEVVTVNGPPDHAAYRGSGYGKLLRNLEATPMQQP